MILTWGNNMTKKPVEVLKLEKKLENEKIWFITSNNENNREVQGCWDAVNYRVRLGHSKIPIFCELKSNFGFINKDNDKKYLLVHYRGNQKLDYEKIKKLTEADFQRIEDETELQNLFGSGFGLVNPFLGFDRSDILQIFDKSLTTQQFIPYTMMTNASHRRWGIEFKPDELINSLPNILIEDVVIENTKFEIKKHKIGILTGNSPESGILLWEGINERIRKNFSEYFLGDISFPEVIIESIPEMGLSMELDKRFEDVKEVVGKGITNLCERGATIVCIACNTTQYFSKMSKKICSKHDNVIYVSIPETTYKYLKKNKIKEFDFLGINYVSDFEKWSGFKNLNKEEFDLYPLEKQYISQINEFAYDLKKKKEIKVLRQNFVRFIKRSTNTNTIILALTELSILYNLEEEYIKKHSEKNYFNTLTILAETIGDMYTKGYLSVMKKSKKIRDE